MGLNPLICGEWDGCSLWMQWTPADPEEKTLYEVQIRLRKNEAQEWPEWMTIVPQGGERKAWAVIPTWKQNWQAEARVRINPGADGPPSHEATADDAGWEHASEVTFNRCTCLFEISSEKNDAHFPAGTTFHCQVDAAACSYRLKEEINVPAGGRFDVEMESLGSGGYFQLDYPGHFDFRPIFGVRIKNLEPSKEDVKPTGRAFTEIRQKEVPDPVAIVVTPRTSY